MRRIMRRIFLRANRYIEMMQKYLDSLAKYPFRKIYYSLIALMIFAFILKLLYPEYELELVLWAPIIEEAVKLFILFLIIRVLRLKGYLGNTWKNEFRRLIFITALVGIFFFAIFEQFSTYLYAPFITIIPRLYAHPIFTF